MSHKAKKIEAGLYEYRGIKVRRDHKIPAGYWGAWTARVAKQLDDPSVKLGFHTKHFNAGSLSHIKFDIDNYRNTERKTK